MNLVALDGDHDGPTNMARDAALLEAAEQGRPGGRVYGWSEPWVSLGRFQDPSRAVRPGSVPTVKRPTGGKAVLHGHDVTLGLAVPLSLLGLTDERCRSVAGVYRAMAQVLVPCLRAAGLHAELGEDTTFVRDRKHVSDCFAVVSANDIVDPETGQKVCGCALRIGERAVLLQASVPVGRPLVDPASVFEDPGPVTWRPLGSKTFARRLDEALLDLGVRDVESPVS
ncbi:MAG: hypothetical protein JST30_11600 [Armatimonadetes bacterium]|nr:hypothetical protein [Armatimonadota bacterium]